MHFRNHARTTHMFCIFENIASNTYVEGIACKDDIFKVGSKDCFRYFLQNDAFATLSIKLETANKGRTYRVLRINRRQLPLTPAWAMTSFAAQGQTFSQSAIVDLKIGGSSSIMSSYVAITRVENRNDFLMFRSFPLELFTKGQQSGLEL